MGEFALQIEAKQDEKALIAILINEFSDRPPTKHSSPGIKPRGFISDPRKHFLLACRIFSLL
jgi:hypothetical protein